MRITRLHLQGIRRHRDLDLAPAPGLTVIRGPNESGKSTVQAALEMALFRKVTSTAREMQDVRTWGTTDDPFVELAFEHEGTTGRLTKRFAGQKGTVELELDGQLITDPGQVDTVVAEMTGLPSEKFLRSTASVRHQELEELDRDEGALRDRLQQSISGADRGTNSARRVLGDAVRRYRAEGVRNPGVVRQTRTELERLRMELAEGETALVRLEADRNALAVAHDRRAQLDAQLTHDQDALDAGERAVRLETSATDAEARYMRLRQAVDLQARITQGERDHPSSRPLPELKEGVRRLKDLQYQIQELRIGPGAAAGPVCRRGRAHQATSMAAVRTAGHRHPGGRTGDHGHLARDHGPADDRGPGYRDRTRGPGCRGGGVGDPTVPPESRCAAPGGAPGSGYPAPAAGPGA